ncbi:TPA_asm: DUF4180 domain-containing protein [Listeria monocytogenes]|nr:DUF4180 domain-containing protein [Listeria monocytogenes]EAE8610801.1 DUF4180 domain-containing protein [Listeria monocytogenes]EAF5298269.1 DUF4180 domain-containing protein [Listeria monocytogenes]EAF5299091.1 DUF4180 domain-containing protein [Listeria monocytogenes]EAF7849372.1 DUF4180 domain-containing protein [Listeria monocytogenes]
MDVKTVVRNNILVALIHSEQLLINDIQSALDMIATVNYETGSHRMVLSKSAFTEDFFKLSTCLAGEILQKFINYGVKIAIVGDFSSYSSKSLKDFIYESNHGKDVFFISTVEEAIERLASV